ncbi:HNH endonuclease signature motif containing protein [Actinomadura craniellae]|nr:HNH endonuclease signature motif containing protein [Actinomadura craniellae]
MPPGPELAAALALIDRSRLSGHDTVVLLQARARQVAHEQAELYADMAEVADRVRREVVGLPGVWDSDVPKFAAAEVAAALRLTKRAAGGVLEDAWLLVERLPAVWRALRAGLIDVPRAKVMVRETRVLPEPVARRVVGQILPQAPELTTGQLAYRVRRLVLEADPCAARNSYELGVAERRIVAGTDPDGTAYLAGYQLPVGPAAAAYERVDAIARAAKQAGDGRPMDQIRADVYLGLLEGTWNGPGPVHRRGVIELTADLPTLLNLADNPAELHGWGPVIADIARQITTQATTRTTVRDTIWVYSITDPLTGRLLHHGTTRRPVLPAPGSTRRRPLHLEPAGSGDTAHPPTAPCTEIGAQAEPTTGTGPGTDAEPVGLDTGPGAGPEGETQSRSPTAGSRGEDIGTGGRDTGTGQTARPAVAAQPAVAAVSGERAGTTERDPRRFLSARDRAHVIARDRTCRGPGCRVSARRSEIDHIVPHAQGGSSTPDNTDAKCGFCHDLKDAGWVVTRTPRGTTLWTSPLGHTYRKPPEPITRPADLTPAERRLAENLDQPP